MIVAYKVPHNEGVEAGIITGPGFDAGGAIVDLYEVDATIQSFATEEEAQAWVDEFLENDENVETENVPGGVRYHVEY